MSNPDCFECCGADPATCIHPEEERHFTRTVGMYDRYVCRLCATIVYSDGSDNA
jgi:hypothetical protein